MGQDLCARCRRPAEEHTEYDVALYATLGAAVSPANNPEAAESAALLALEKPHPAVVTVEALGSPVVAESKASALDVAEGFSLGVGLVLTAGLWFHLFFLIPYCELERTAGKSPSPCHEYYGSFDGPRGDWAYHFWTWWLFGILVFCYFYDVALSPVRRYLGNVLPSGIEAYASKLVDATPQLVWSIQCYHMEKEYYRARGRRVSREKRVNTHSATAKFRFDAVRDVSGAMIGSTFAPVRRLRSHKVHIFADSYTRDVHGRELDEWVRENDKDTHKCVTLALEIPGFETWTLAYPSGAQPFGFSSVAYWAAALFAMTIPFRMYFFARSTPIDFYCVKELSRSDGGDNRP